MGMIDVSEKAVVRRTAVATGTICLKAVTITAIREKTIKKGDVLMAAEIAALQGVKKTPELLAHCHQLPLDAIDVQFTIGSTTITSTVTVKATAKTGVEMDALTGVSIALLTIWDMVKYLEKDADGQYPDTRITNIMIIQKTKGDYHDR